VSVRFVILLLALFAASIPGSIAGESTEATGGFSQGVTFAEYSPLASRPELMRRLMDPLTAAKLLKSLSRSGGIAQDQPIDLAQEHFVVRVPTHMPASGYALLVFLPPWEGATLPQGWGPVLERHGVIYVSAAKTGNDTSITERREPMALLAAFNAMQKYRIDPSRVYIGGFSGGSRVALRVALGYPDVFHGALLIAGSDPIGNSQAPLPPAELFREFQTSTRLVFLTGADDEINLNQDLGSRQSLREWCVFDVDTQDMPRQGHGIANPSGLERALGALTRHAHVDSAALDECQARLDSALTERFRRLNELLTENRYDDARTLLQQIDLHYGGYAMPKMVEFAQRIESLRR
jgi:dienelactone hydrolase